MKSIKNNQQSKNQQVMATYQDVKIGETLNVIYKGVQTTGIVIHKSSVQINVRFWSPSENVEVQRAFTVNGKLRYIKNEDSRIVSKSL